MKSLCTIGTGILFAILCLSACNDDHAGYPTNYTGFDKITESCTVDCRTEEQDISLKIIAIKKREEDREVSLSARSKPGTQPAFKLLDTRLVIPAKKKYATVRIRIYPKQIKHNQEIRITCTPADKEVKQSQLLLKLTVK